MLSPWTLLWKVTADLCCICCTCVSVNTEYGSDNSALKTYAYFCYSFNSCKLLTMYGCDMIVIIAWPGSG